jgi:hypothetical protein
LRPRRERLRDRRAPEKRDELAAFHSITSSASASSFVRHVEAKRPRGLEVNHQIEFGRLLDRNVGRLCAAQNLVDESGGAPKQVREVRPIRAPRKILLAKSLRI